MLRPLHPMPLQLQEPITYLISSGQTKYQTTPASEDFARLLNLIRAAVAAHVGLIQLREKNLSARALYELTLRAAEITRESKTRLLVNDRADIASMAGADGVHLTSHSLDTHIVRRTFGREFLIGVSTHSLSEARAAREGGADFAVFGPIFDTPSKRPYGLPLSLTKLSEAVHTLSPFPLIAIGGITRGNARDVLSAGASGIAAIRLFNDAQNLRENVRAIESMR